MKERCDVCGRPFPRVSERGPDGAVVLGSKALTGFMMQVPPGGAKFYAPGLYAVCMDCVLATMGVAPNHNLEELEEVKKEAERLGMVPFRMKGGSD